MGIPTKRMTDDDLAAIEARLTDPNWCNRAALVREVLERREQATVTLPHKGLLEVQLLAARKDCEQMRELATELAEAIALAECWDAGGSSRCYAHEGCDWPCQAGEALAKARAAGVVL